MRCSHPTDARVRTQFDPESNYREYRLEQCQDCGLAWVTRPTSDLGQDYASVTVPQEEIYLLCFCPEIEGPHKITDHSPRVTQPSKTLDPLAPRLMEDPL